MYLHNVVQQQQQQQVSATVCARHQHQRKKMRSRSFFVRLLRWSVQIPGKPLDENRNNTFCSLSKLDVNLSNIFKSSFSAQIVRTKNGGAKKLQITPL